MAKGFTFISYKDRIKAELDKVAERAITMALEVVKSAAKSNAPVDFGFLRDTIDYKLKNINGQVVGIVGSPLKYAIYVEFGTGEFAENGAGRKGGWVYQDPEGEWVFTWGQEPEPFMRDAFRQNKKQIIEIIGKEFNVSFGGDS